MAESYTITLNPPTHCTLAVRNAADAPVTSLAAGAVAIVDARPEEGYVLASTLVTDGTGAAVVTTNGYFRMPETDVAVSAVVTPRDSDVDPADKAALVALALASQTLAASTHVSADGSDVPTTGWWTTEEAREAFMADLSGALKVADDSDASQDAVAAQLASLTSAREAFLAARAQGAQDQTPEGGGDPPDAGDPENLYRMTRRMDGSLDAIWYRTDGTAWTEAPSSTDESGTGTLVTSELPLQAVAMPAGEPVTLSWDETSDVGFTMRSDAYLNVLKSGLFREGRVSGFVGAYVTFLPLATATWATVVLASATAVRLIKMEHGTEPTAWTESPYDVDTRGQEDDGDPDEGIVGPDDGEDLEPPDHATPAEPVEWVDPPEPDRVVEVSLDAVAAAAADSQHFWTRERNEDGAGAGAFVTDLPRDEFEDSAGATTSAADSFAGDGATVTFRLSHEATSAGQVAVTVDGAEVIEGVTATTAAVTFDAAPAPGASILVAYDYASPFPDLGDASEGYAQTDSFEADGETTAFALSHEATTTEGMSVTVDGTDVTGDVTLSATQVEFELAPDEGRTVAVTYRRPRRPWHNLLMNSLGVLLRRGLKNLATFTKGAVAFYDGEGNEASNIRALFGASGAQIGKSSEPHVTVDEGGMGVYDADGASVANFGEEARFGRREENGRFTTIDANGTTIYGPASRMQVSTRGLGWRPVGYRQLSIITENVFQVVHDAIDNVIDLGLAATLAAYVPFRISAGRGSHAAGANATAIGYSVWGTDDEQVVIGRLNADPAGKALVIGNGDPGSAGRSAGVSPDTTFSNALSVDWDGNVECQGAVVSGPATYGYLAGRFTYGRLAGR